MKAVYENAIFPHPARQFTQTGRAYRPHQWKHLLDLNILWMIRSAMDHPSRTKTNQALILTQLSYMIEKPNLWGTPQLFVCIVPPWRN